MVPQDFLILKCFFSFAPTARPRYGCVATQTAITTQLKASLHLLHY